MNRSPGPLSPVSIGGGSEWSGISKYQGLEENPPYSPNNRGNLITPPVSSGSNGMMNGGGFPPRGPESQNGNVPSPPASIARSSIPTSLYNGSMNGGPAGGRDRRDEQFEGILSEHYVSLKRFLAASLRDEKGNPRPNKARDKLLRLSPVQFQELSTDVFDELLRRQAAGRNQSVAGLNEQNAPPQFLLPKDTFHPKRNQARQKLSTLPPPRFRDLATDVFYELERRFPRFAGGDISRSGNGTPVDPRMRMRRPSEASSVGYARSESRGTTRGLGGGQPGSPGMPPNDYGRPQPKTFQSNTLVPNKSTMVEDDDDQDNDSDAFGLESAVTAGVGAKSEEDKKQLKEYEEQVVALQEKVGGLEEKLRQKDEELNDVLDGERSRSTAANAEKQEFSDLRLKLEEKLADAENLNVSLQSELDRLRAEHSETERDLSDQLEQLRVSGGGGGGNEALERENEELRAELEEQQQTTDDVRREAGNFLREMKLLTERNGTSWEKEEQLVIQVNRLEAEVEDWRNRYARTKTQLRNARASSIGLTIQPKQTTSSHNSPDGLVKDVHVTKFQISIDELLRTARSETPENVVEYMKNVVICVRSITQDIDNSTNNPELAQGLAKLKARVSATANNLITASKNFTAAKGLSPVSLLDAAASHLTTSVVELVSTVRIRPTPAGELEDDDNETLQPIETPSYYPTNGDLKENISAPFMGMRQSNVSSMYSPVNSPRDSRVPRSRSGSKTEPWRRSISRSGQNGMNGKLPPAPLGSMGAFGIRGPEQNNEIEDLKIFLEDQTAFLVQMIQSLVSSIRSDNGVDAIIGELASIAAVVEKVMSATESSMDGRSDAAAQLRQEAEGIVRKLEACRERVLDAGERGAELAREQATDAEWKVWTQGLPPVAFEIARETKELVRVVDGLDEEEDFA
ncbi:component of the polarisome [Pseudogymnoascus verrucosus]|uniref:Component of the polarisome n=1 Tax=Pseudogymnoascus verrucosus TaxID=342668 RepID=A0A1B8G7Y3_9PEZI|nr:component of the polarisome [Pseudogymnoascus verrucosus]OBT91934.1 component of the polarisome [Pseudogymnoascus verrucosus]